MNLFFRFIILILKRLWISKPIQPFSKCITKFRVNAFDLDLNFHMNNGRYFSIMDLGRFDIMLQSNTFWTIIKKGYYPVVSSQSIRFKRSLGPFMAFDVISQIESWDERNLYMKQQFIKDGSLYAEGFVKARFRQRGRKKSIPTKEIFEIIGVVYTEDKISELATTQRYIESILAQEENIEHKE